MSSAQLLEFVARLTYNIDGLSGKLRLYFSQFLTFHFSKHLSVNHIQDIENKRASKKFEDDDEITKAAESLSFEDRCWCVAAIQLLQAEAERIDDRVVSRRLEKIAEHLVKVLTLGDHLDLISTARTRISEEVYNYESRPVVRIPAAIWPLAFDFAIRCTLLVYFSLNELNKLLLTGINAVFVTGFVMTIVLILNRRHRKANLMLLESYGGAARFKLEYRVTAGQYTWLAIFLGVSTFVSYLLPDQLHAFAFFGLASYYFVYLRFFRLGRIRENELVRQLESAPRQADTLDMDENDEMIVNLETKLNASTSRLDAYVLESALFGALSFSGFLQIMASDLISFADLENFAQGIFATSQALIHLQGDALANGLAALNNKVSLFCLVSVESLLCSIFFLAVIASRLRFSDVADNVRTAINLAHAFNLKEEALYHESERSEIRHSRLQALTLRVNRQLAQASISLSKVGPIMAYMEYFRNAGILVFLIIIISSSLFITSVLGWTFLALVGATFLYFNRESINTAFKAATLQLRVAFLRRSYFFFTAAIVPFVVALVLRNSFYWKDTQLLTAMGYFLIGLFILVWLVLASHFDKEFGDVEMKADGEQTTPKWVIVKNLVAIMAFIFFLAMAFKQKHIAGADEMAFIAAPAIGILMYFNGYYFSKIKWFGLIMGAAMATTTVGFLFKILHLQGADEMVLVGMISLVGCTLVVWWKRRAFHSLLLRFCLALLFMSFTVVSGVFQRIELAYAHRTFQLSPVRNVLSAHYDGLYGAEDNAAKAVEAAEWYIATYGTTVPQTAVYEDLVRIYNNYVRDALHQASGGNIDDPALLANALVAVRERDRIIALLGFSRDWVGRFDMSFESDVLMAMNRKEDALIALQQKLQQINYPEQREYLNAKLSAINAPKVEGGK